MRKDVRRTGGSLPELHIARAHVLSTERAEQRFKCFRCKRDLPEAQFCPMGRPSDCTGTIYAGVIYLHPHCHVCRKQARSAYTRHRLYSCALHRQVTKLITSARGGAWQRGLLFAIDDEDVLERYMAQEGRCAVTGRIMTLVGDRTQRINRTRMSIDRIDSGSHYSRDNIQLVCAAINNMKGDLTMDELRLWAAAIVLHNADNGAEEAA